MRPRYLIPRLPLPVRIMVFLVIAGAGIYLQLFVQGRFFPGGFALVAAILFLLTRKYKNKPMDLGFEDWKPVSMNEFQRILDNFEKTKHARYSVLYRTWLGVVLMVLLIISTGVLSLADAGLMPVFTMDLAILIIPVFLSGSIKLWIPRMLKMKMDTFQPIVEKMEGQESVVLTPYLRLDKDSEGRQIPEDVRLMIELKRNPEDFVGVQLQVAINNGPNGAVPYMYGVFLCNEKGTTFTVLNSFSYGNFIKEPGGDGEYRYIVIRQNTDSGGYHTTREDIVRLFGLVMKALEKIG